MVDSTVTFSAVTSAAEAAAGRAASTNSTKARNRFIEIPSNLWRDHGDSSAAALGSGENVPGASMDAPHYLFLERPAWAAIFWISYVAFFFATMWVHGRERGKVQGDKRDH